MKLGKLVGGGKKMTISQELRYQELLAKLGGGAK